jgi:lysine 6-dehydrogenase
MKILVLGGCGAMGAEATRDLAATSSFEEIAVADRDLEAASRLVRELGQERLKAVGVDASDPAALTQLFAAYDLVLNCTSYVFGLIVTEAAVAAKKPLLDLGGLYNTPKQLAMNDRARDAGITIVLGMGATPGVTNLMARDGASRMDAVREIHLAFATYRPIAPSPGLLSTVLDEFSPSTRRFFYKDGSHVDAKPFDGEKEVTFAAPIGKVSTYYVPHSEIHTLPRFIPGVSEISVRGTWRPEIMAALRNYLEVGLLSADPIEVKGARVAPKDLLTALFLQNGGWPGDDQWAFYLNVEVIGEKDGRRAVATYNLSHPTPAEWGKNATGKVTGIPASIGAQKLAAGEGLSKGVIAPEIAFFPRPFFDELAKRRILIQESFALDRQNAP